MRGERAEDSTVADLSPRDTFFLVQLNNSSSPEVLREIEKFIQEVDKLDRLGEEALTAVLLRDYYEDRLTVDQLQVVRELIFRNYEQSTPLKLYSLSADLMSKSVASYFGREDQLFDYCLIAPLPYTLANRLLNLKAEGIVQARRQDFERRGKNRFLIENFPDPNTDMLGIWMSIKGVHFDSNKVRQLP